MVTNAEITEKILMLEHLVLTVKNGRNGNQKYVESMNKLLSLLEGVGIIEDLALNGSESSYFIIDGNSWQNACEILEINEAPNFVLLEENHFFTLLQNQLNGNGSRKY